jgi:hypothetical protein
MFGPNQIKKARVLFVLALFLISVLVYGEGSMIGSIRYYNDILNSNTRFAEITLGVPPTYIAEHFDLIESDNQLDFHTIPLRVEIPMEDHRPIIKAYNLVYTYEDGNLSVTNPRFGWEVSEEEERLIGSNPQIEVSIAQNIVASIWYNNDILDNNTRIAAVTLAVPPSYVAENFDLIESDNRLDSHMIPLRVEIPVEGGQSIVKAHNLVYTFEDGDLSITNLAFSWEVSEEEERLIGSNPEISVEITS